MLPSTDVEHSREIYYLVGEISSGTTLYITISSFINTVSGTDMLVTSALAIEDLLGPVGVAYVVVSVLVIGYVFYMRFLHPLARYPGPAVASLTNIWKAYYVYKLVLHEKLVELHQQYGPVIRIGPNHLHFWDGEAISTIYKGGRKMGKTEFYDAFTAFNPNLFGGTDEDVGVSAYSR